MEEPNEMDQINQFDHVVVYIWRSSGVGGRGVGHVAARLHWADYNRDIFVSLWPGDEHDANKRWHKNFQEVFNAEHDHGPNQTLVFFTLDIPSMIARLNTLKIQTEEWVMMPTKEESLNPETIHHNCCTAVWNVLKAGRINGPNGLFTDKEFKTAVSTAKSNTSSKASAQLPHSSSQLFAASSKSQDSHQTRMVASGPSTLTWESLLSGERYGPDILFEILKKAKMKEVEKIYYENHEDPRLAVHFPGHNDLQKSDGLFDEGIYGDETEDYSAGRLLANSSRKVKR